MNTAHPWARITSTGATADNKPAWLKAAEVFALLDAERAEHEAELETLRQQVATLTAALNISNRYPDPLPLVGGERGE